MKFALIMATLGRTEEIERLLSSLAAQTHRDFELIVVDQNEDDRLLEPFLAPYRMKFPILHLRSEKGVCRARNAGLERVTGEVIGFPDDDCWYPPDLLERVAGFLIDRRDLDGITVRSVLVPEIDERPTRVGAGRFDEEAGLLNKTNMWVRAVAYTLFLRRSVVEAIGGFDESLGVGAGTPWGSAEDTDYSLRAVEAGFKIYYSPEVFVYHRPPPEDHPALIDRAYRYGAGMGRVWRKHDYPLWFVAYYLLRPVGGAILSLLRGRGGEARYYFNSLRGRLRGWRFR
jgi:glycosyltransferase involved in cell wall biosynthesis